MPGQLFVLDRAVVGLVVEAVEIGRDHLAAIGHEVGDAVDDERRRGNALERPVVGASRRQLLEGRLPHELAGRFAERHQHAAVARLLGIAHRFVVGADQHHAAGDHRIAVRLRSELGDPLDVLAGLHVPGRRHALERRHHVARRRPTPHGPVGRDGSWRGENREGNELQRPCFIVCLIMNSPTLIRDHRCGTGLQPGQVQSTCSDTRSRYRNRALRSRHRRGPGCLRGAGSCRSSRSSTRPAPASPVGHTLPRTCADAVGSVVDAQLHPIPRVRVPLERDAHGHLIGGLPRVQLELLAVAEEHQRIPLIDEAGVTALTALLGHAHVGFDGVALSGSPAPSGPSRGGRRFRRAAAPAPCRRPRRCAGTLCPVRRSTTSAGPRRLRVGLRSGGEAGVELSKS